MSVAIVTGSRADRQRNRPAFPQKTRLPWMVVSLRPAADHPGDYRSRSGTYHNNVKRERANYTHAPFAFTNPQT